MLFIFETYGPAAQLHNRTDKPLHGDDRKDQIRVLMADTPAGMIEIERTLVHMHDLQDLITLDGMVENINRHSGSICF